MSRLTSQRYGIYVVNLFVESLTKTISVEIMYRSENVPIIAWTQSFYCMSYDAAISNALAEYITAIKTGVLPEYGTAPVDFNRMRGWVEDMVNDPDFVMAFNASSAISHAVFHHGKEYLATGKVLINNRVVHYNIVTTLIGPSKKYDAIYHVTLVTDHTDNAECGDYNVAGISRSCEMTITNKNNVFDINDFVKQYEDKLVAALGL